MLIFPRHQIVVGIDKNGAEPCQRGNGGEGGVATHTESARRTERGALRPNTDPSLDSEIKTMQERGQSLAWEENAGRERTGPPRDG